MDIDLLSKMVKELILDNEKVVLPGLGCFVAEVVPATFSDRGYTLNPPYRKLYFRSHPDEGRILAELYSRSNHVDVEMADRILRDFLKELKSVLFSRKTVIFPGLGRLRATKENNIFFIADEDLDIYPISFALETISMKSHQEQEERMASAIGQLKDMMSGLSSEPVQAPIPEPAVETPAIETPAIETPAAETLESSYDAPAEEPEAPAEEPEVSVEETVEAPVEEESEVDVEEIPAVQEQIPELRPSSEDELLDIEPAEIKPGKKHRPAGKIIGWTVAGILLAMALLVGIYFLLDAFAPEAIDRLLYSKEELEVLNYGK